MQLRHLVPVAALAALLPLTARAQSVAYGLGSWPQNSLGNHRAVLHVAAPAEAVTAHIEWRRRDLHPETKRIIVTDSANHRVANAAAVRVTREAGDLVFQPTSGSGTYYVYYMPYGGSVRSNYPRISYLAPDSTADAGWIARARADSVRPKLPVADLVRIEAADSMSRMDPMEVIATAEETAALRARHSGEPFVVFAEDRTRAIRMTDDLPQRWVATGGDAAFAGTAQRDEFFAFQLGVWALSPLDSVRTEFSPLRSDDGATIPASAFSSFTTGGIDWQGHAFTRRVTVPTGKVQPLWAGVMIPPDAAPGVYRGSATVLAAHGARQSVPLAITVAATRIADHGDDEPWRLSRLRWLDSRFRLDSTRVPPYTPIRVRGVAHAPTLDILGRTITLAPTGLPAQLTTHFTSTMTAISQREQHELLAAPITFVATDSAGRPLPWRGEGVTITRRTPDGGAVLWRSASHAGPLSMATHAQLDFDGNLEYTIGITAQSPVSLGDLGLVVPFRAEAARYLMGMNRKGGAAPAQYDWQWNVRRNQDAVWIGSVDAGLQLTLKDDRYVRPLNTNFYQLRPLVMPASWENGGKGGCRFRLEGGVYRATCTGGARRMTPGDTLWFNLRLLVTPFHPMDTRTHFTERYFHKFAPVDTIRAAGANVVNVHHATPINPWINYPFLRPEAMRAYADSVHAAGMRFKIYYTVRELSYHAPELWALRSLDHEVLAGGPGGGHSWLQEHVGSDYIPGWVVPEIRDVALVTSGISRWHNYYIEGLQWLVDHEHIDGLYLDDVAFDRITMQRVRRVLASSGAPGERIDLHSANQFDENDGFASSANLYLEHFPYIDRLWFGEYFDYDSPPDYWLVEMSGVPFGLMGEMLQDGGNPWRGMLFGMTNRLPWAGDPRPVWKAWDAFGIADARMIGWWSERPPVTTGRNDVLATTYVRPGRALISVASWAPDTARVQLAIDWTSLGISARGAVLHAPAIAGFQDERTFAPGEPIPVAPKRGWLLVVEPAPPRATRH